MLPFLLDATEDGTTGALHALGCGSIEELFGEPVRPDAPSGRLLGI